MQMDAARRHPHINGMTKANTPVADSDPKAVDRWDDEGGAPALGPQATGRRVEDEKSYLKGIRPYTEAIAKILRKVRSELRTRWDSDAAEGEDGSE
jgi:hypothetical protein